ncbi:MAG: FAD-dependent monooxygenase [Pseudomonadota bacterium]
MTYSQPTGRSTADALVVGGGLSGGLAALALADAGLAVALVDQLEPAKITSAKRDGRTTAIAYASSRVFKRLGLWDAIAPGAGAIRDILVTEGRGRDRFRRGGAADAFLRFDVTELGEEEALGFIVENHVLLQAIHEGLRRSNSITVRAPARVATLERSGRVAVAILDDGSTIEAGLAVAADGRSSRLRAEAGVKTIEHRYGQTALTVIVRLERDHEGVAHELFTPTGPFAVLPMAGRRASVVWSEDETAAKAIRTLPPSELATLLQDRFGEMLGRVEIDGPVVAYPLGLVFAQRMTAERLVLVGDAAHGIHPIAGQGYNLAVKDVAALAAACGEAAVAGLDIGTADVLQRYERARRFDNTAMAAGTHAVNALFKTEFAPVALARQAGIAAVNRIPPLRTFFMREAGGDVGALPPLMRPL